MGRHLSPEGRKRQLRGLSPRHKEVCRKLALGEKPKDIAADLKISRELISIVRGSVLAQEFMSTLEADRDGVVQDIDGELRGLALSAVTTLQDALDGKIGGSAYDHSRLRAALEVLDRIGHSKIARVQSQVQHVNEAQAALALMKKRRFEVLAQIEARPWNKEQEAGSQSEPQSPAALPECTEQ